MNIAQQVMNHRFAGASPDAVNGWEARDPDCGACAALDALAEQGEVEWEYGYELIESDTRDVLTRGFSYDTAREAGAVSRRRAIEEHDPDYPALEPLVVKRRKAGPWLPVDEKLNGENRSER